MPNLSPWYTCIESRTWTTSQTVEPLKSNGQTKRFVAHPTTVVPFRVPGQVISPSLRLRSAAHTPNRPKSGSSTKRPAHVDLCPSSAAPGRENEKELQSKNKNSCCCGSLQPTQQEAKASKRRIILGLCMPTDDRGRTPITHRAGRCQDRR